MKIHPEAGRERGAAEPRPLSVIPVSRLHHALRHHGIRDLHETCSICTQHVVAGKAVIKEMSILFNSWAYSQA